MGKQLLKELSLKMLEELKKRTKNSPMGREELAKKLDTYTLRITEAANQLRSDGINVRRSRFGYYIGDPVSSGGIKTPYQSYREPQSKTIPVTVTVNQDGVREIPIHIKIIVSIEKP
jgi:biotin operon repressor